MKILIFAGTKNGRELVEKLVNSDYQVFVSSMSVYGNDLLPSSGNVYKIFGKKSMDGIGEIIIQKDIDLVIDSTHPYAKEISMNIKEACDITNTRLIRYERKSSIPKHVGIHFESMYNVCKFLSDRDGNILFTTGINEVPNIIKYISVNRIHVRVIPVKSSILKAKACGLIMNQVIQKDPPFNFEENMKHIKENDIKFLVTKDSGSAGNTDDKIEAALNAGVEILVIDRPDISYDNIFYDAESLIREL